ncbi:cytochrome c oxidase subunit II [Saliphagus infecundisoli]|uniref:Cytochrome c oxidase subunit II n=1 Tax=Saliphagus infecundisoli TaxID=1849069 RepID=A0ABD5QL99_9EURY|nr:hypothetical protein [Saliphagus infecundisoli]
MTMVLAIDSLVAFGPVLDPGVPTTVGSVPASTSTAEVIGRLHRRVMGAGVVIALLVGLALYHAVRTDGRDGVDPVRRYELAWIAGSAVTLGGVGVAAAEALGTRPFSSADGGVDLEVAVRAERFEFRFEYPGQNGRTADELVVPVDRSIHLTINSMDVIHSLHVPELGLKQMAVPGEEHAIRTTTIREGEYRGYCGSYCGSGHARMEFRVRIVDDETFEAWLSE